MSKGVTLFSRRPVVFLRATLTLPDADKSLMAGRDAAIEALAEALDAVDVDPALLRISTRGIPQNAACRLLAGDLVARLATCLMHKAGAPDGDFEALTDFGDDVLACWNDWMEGVGVVAGHHAVGLMELAFAAPAELENAAKSALKAVYNARIDSFMAPMVKAAEKRGIPWRSLRKGHPVLVYGQGSRQQWFHGTMSNRQSRATVHLTIRKHLSMGLLRAAGLPVPEHELVSSAAEARAAAQRLGFPVVVKPDAGSRSENITLNIADEEEVERAFNACQSLGLRSLVEKQYPGLPYRVTVCNGRAFGALLHAVPFVTGDGRSTLRELIERTNASRQAAVEDDHALPTPLHIDEFGEQMEWRLREQDITLDDVPADGRRIFLTITPALARGGIQVDVTEQMHPNTLALAEEAARIIGAVNLGVDFLITDIGRPHAEAPLVINEVNAAPGVRSHACVEGPPRDLPEALFSPFFPGGDQGRIPIVAAVGRTAGNSLVLLARLLREAGETVGLADSRQAQIDDYLLKPAEGAAAHPGCALLRDKRPSAAILSLGLHDILSKGIPSDRLDVVAIPHDILARTQTDLQLAALKTVVSLPGDTLVLPREADSEALEEAAPHRRLILVADAQGTAPRHPAHVTVVAAESRPDSVWLTAINSAMRMPLGRIPTAAYEDGTHLWAAALLFGLGKDPLEIARLLPGHGAKVATRT